MRFVDRVPAHTLRVRAHLATAVSAIAMIAAMPLAYGAEAPATQAAQATIDEITVTGTRVVRDGYEAPTPVSVLGADELNLAGRNNLAETVSRLPSFSNSILPRGRSATLNVTGTTGVSNLNLRGMGAFRSLVLLDGARVVGANLSGDNGSSVDIGIMPDGLISRVDVVTGGASAAYGSDALSGVINFVLDREFTGIKGNVEGGISTYGDGGNYKVNLSAGVPFAGDRGHLLISGQYAHDNGIKGAPRDWRLEHNAAVINNPTYTATNGQPRLLDARDFGLALAAPGGLITAGPLKGITFGPGGNPFQLRYGPIVSGSYMLGGDWQYTRMDQHTDLAFKMSRPGLFTRVGYDLADSVNVYALYQFSQIEGYSEDVRSWNFANLTVRNDNPYIPAAVAAQMTALALTNFQLGTTNEDVGPMIQNNISTLRRWVVGAEGNFDAFDSSWAWEAYYQSSATHISSNNFTIHNARLGRALDAVRNANGAIVCRVNADAVTTNDDPACIPYNGMGIGVNTDAALKYVTGWSHGHLKLSQDVAALSTNGEPFELWAGPVSLALGIEHRIEEVSGVPNPDDETNSWFAGNYKASFGTFNVTEGFIETVVPLAKGAAWAEAFDLNASARFTSYSTSGYVTTWKLGATWTPVEDIRFRATRSRDIRAPNLGELFNAGRVNTGTLLDPRNGQTLSIFTTTSGNVNLNPETANTTGVGAVYAPSWLEGFTASIDFYNIEIEGAITSLGAQQYVDRCFAGDAYLCTFVTRDPTTQALTHVSILPANVLSQTARGFDIEATYRLPLASLSDSMDGDLTFRFMGTRSLRMTTVDVLGQTIEGSGVNAEGMGTAPSSGFWMPKFKANISATYSLDPFTASLTMRHTSAGVYNRQFVECSTGCPAATALNPTIDNNDIPGASYFDLALSYKIDGDRLEAFASIENMMDKDPPQVGGSLGGAFFTGSGALTVYDIMGRLFHAGVRFRY